MKRSLHIGINAHALGSQRGGDETYMRNMIRALGNVDGENRYTLFFSSALPDTAIAGAERMKQVAVRPASAFIRLPMTLPIALARAGVQVVHLPYVAPPFCPAPVVVSVHDIAFEHFPQFFAPNDTLQMRLMVPLAVRQARRVITLSEFSKRDIMRRYCVPPEKVIVVPCAADPQFRPLFDRTGVAATIAKYGVTDQFILSVGNLQPRKNLKTLISAYVRLRQANATQHKLVVVGRRSWLADDVFEAARSSGYSDDLIFTGYVSDDDLVALYNAADLFVYPSLFEGFGLPPLEAMACGTPVVTANTAALPEVVGDAAITVDPRDGEALASAIVRILGNNQLQDQMRKAGLAHAAAFSWEASARQLIKVYHDAACV